MSCNILDKIIERKRLSLIESKRSLPLKKLIEFNDSQKNRIARDFKKSLQNPGRISLIAEVKKASPSAGVIREDFDPGMIIARYEASSVDAISVITEENFFMGSPDSLALVKSFSSKPALMKDFVIDEYQIHSALCWGADAVLLIAKILSAEKLKGFISLSKELGLDCLVEAHDAPDIEKAAGAGAEIIGINNRDLETFNVDINTSVSLLGYIPGYAVKVSESGIRSKSDINALREAGADAVLAGEVLMRSADIAYGVKKLLLDD